ncbi:MAG: histidine kinase [Candidatus Krumholzibacteriota bacterium]|nr:histidine kinase [Candidatus Krumholzibacteriota bacterium]
MARVTLTGDQFTFLILLLRMGIMASVSGVLITSSFFKRLIFLDRRSTGQNWWLAVLFGVMLTAGAAVRVLVGYEGIDLSLAGVFLVGLMGGIIPGGSVGFFVSLPGTIRGEWATLPLLVVGGLAGGLIRSRLLDREEIWGFSPIPFSNIARAMRVFVAERRLDPRAVILLSVLSLDVVRCVVAERTSPPVVFAVSVEHWWMWLFVWFSTLACVGIPIKIWNNTRVEMLLEEQKATAMQARFDALRRQINPHFLFNTLNAATSCIWEQPEKTRWILVKLSAILRRLLQQGDDFVPLSRELEFIEDYLSLEEARFGKESIRVEKKIDPRAMDVPVPVMILQPIVENAVRHGISPKIGGGTVHISAVREGERLCIVVRDDGVGFGGPGGSGIGLSNVSERLSVGYPGESTFRIDSAPGRGTTVAIEIPVERRRHGA